MGGFEEAVGNSFETVDNFREVVGYFFETGDGFYERAGRLGGFLHETGVCPISFSCFPGASEHCLRWMERSMRTPEIKEQFFGASLRAFVVIISPIER
jgi:hypothetical protein